VRFLADECCPTSIVTAIRQAGHDVLYVREETRGITDREVASIAQGEDRILITEDYDFGELVVRQGVALPGLVILALSDQPRDIRIQRTLETIDRLHVNLLGNLVVVEPARERLRPLGAG
jgi:predicted nuclease of predicted toxin-antitoxin system